MSLLNKLAYQLCLLIVVFDQSGQSLAVGQEEFTAESILDKVNGLFSKLDDYDRSVTMLLRFSQAFSSLDNSKLAESCVEQARKKTLRDESRNDSNHRSLIKFYNQHGSIAQAYEVVFESPRLSSHYVARRMLLAELEHGTWDKAVKYLKTLIRTEGKATTRISSTLILFAVAAHGLGLFDEAMKLVDKYVEDPVQALQYKSDIWFRLADKSWRSNEKRKALFQLNQSIKAMEKQVQPSLDSEFYSRLFLRDFWEDNLVRERIEEIIELAELKNADISQLKVRMASTIFEDALTNEQIELLECLLDDFEGSEYQRLVIQYCIAVCKIRNGDLDEALDEYESVLARDWQDSGEVRERNLKASMYFALATRSFDEGDYPLALHILDRCQIYLKSLGEKERSRIDDKRIRYLTASLIQKKVAIPISLEPNSRIKLLLELAEILSNQQ